jgi:hypothetical protein
MHKTNPLDPALPVWLADDGKPLSCIEKIKVLNENMVELEELVRDMLEDGVLMGCSEQLMRTALKELVDTVALRF